MARQLGSVPARASGDIPGIAVVTAVIVHRSQPQACVRTGQALVAQAEQAGVSLRLVVADNGSSPEALAVLRAGLPGADLLELGANTGFGPGANAGLRHFLATDPATAGDWVLVCPHDASPEALCLERLLTAVAAHPGAGLASAEYGDTSTNVKPMVHKYCGSYLVPSLRVPGWEDSGYPHGTLMVASRACLNDIGLF
ncbi:MAG: glycosyltransferase family 2 protein, partial [Acidimicrobiales bacterium]